MAMKRTQIKLLQTNMPQAKGQTEKLKECFD